MSAAPYYREVIVELLDEFDIELTEKEADEFVASLMISIENESLATGSFHIPNPMEAVLRQARVDHAREQTDARAREQELERQIEELRRDVRYWRGRVSSGGIVTN